MPLTGESLEHWLYLTFNHFKKFLTTFNSSFRPLLKIIILQSYLSLIVKLMLRIITGLPEANAA